MKKIGVLAMQVLSWSTPLQCILSDYLKAEDQLE